MAASVGFCCDRLPDQLVADACRQMIPVRRGQLSNANRRSRRLDSLVFVGRIDDEYDTP